ncbi:hypothetical protein EON80_20100 [bacterium]|nr:MAG: hypothetical protein EON80_20100 [bacterium]
MKKQPPVEAPGESTLFSCAQTPIKWRRLGDGTFLFVESKEPFGFRVDCVTAEGKPANPTPTFVGEQTFPAGQFYRACAHKDGKLVFSSLWNSMAQAKEACEHFRLHGIFPKI